jgi:hypothetical protein
MFGARAKDQEGPQCRAGYEAVPKNYMRMHQPSVAVQLDVVVTHEKGKDMADLNYIVIFVT